MSCESLCVFGESSNGKSTSLRTLNPAETFVISVAGKSLPIKGSKKNYVPLNRNKDGKWEGNFYVSSKSAAILKLLNIINKEMPWIKNVVVDDFQYILSFEFVERSTEVGYGKFSELAQHAMDILRFTDIMRPDCTMIFLTHSENEGTELEPKMVIKTIGRMLKEKVTLEGLFTYVFFAKAAQDENGKMQYKFVTNNDGTCVAKSPMGMFDELEVDNDMQMVLDKIKEYNGD